MDELKRAVVAYLAAVDRMRSVEIGLNNALLRKSYPSTHGISIELNGAQQEVLDREVYLRTVLEK